MTNAKSEMTSTERDVKNCANWSAKCAAEVTGEIAKGTAKGKGRGREKETGTDTETEVPEAVESTIAKPEKPRKPKRKSEKPSAKGSNQNTNYFYLLDLQHVNIRAES